MKKTLSQLTKFTITSSIGIVMHMSFLVLITELLGIFYIISYFLGLIISGIVNFFLNRNWTFRENGAPLKCIKKQYQEFFTINIILDLMGAGLLYFLTEAIGTYYVISQAIVLIIIWITLFIAYKKYIFKK